MRIQLFDETDLKGFEDLLFRAMVRAMRVAKREGLIQGLEAPKPEEPKPEHEEIARRVALLIPEGARVQVGPSPVGDVLLRLLTVPVTIDSGLLPDAVHMRLNWPDSRSCIAGAPPR